MKKIALLSLFTFICACAMAQAQIINYVKNPSFEEYTKCPDDRNQIGDARYWSCAVDTVGEPYYAPEYYNICGVPSLYAGLPSNISFYQNAHSGDAIIGAHFFYDKTPPPPTGVAPNWRDYAQGHLIKPLQSGKAYCISFWLNVADASGYAHDNIGAYLDNGNINKRSPAGIEITDVVPQVYTHTIIKDTMNWTKVEGSFVATGNETHITLGNFAKNIDVDTFKVYYFTTLNQYSYYLIDDVSVIPIDLDVKAGADTWVEQGSKRKIGRIDDSATVMGLDCKWYKKGMLIDSGAIISVNANAIKGVVDTYVVVQTICGVVKSDTVLVKTVGLGVHEFGFENTFAIFPNPSNGTINITTTSLRGTKQSETISTKIYDVLGRLVHQQKLVFSNQEATLKLNVVSGTYLIELQDEAGNVQRERIALR